MLRSFRQRIILTSLALILIALVIISFLIMRISLQTYQQQMQRNLTQQLESQAAFIGGWMQERQTMLGATAEVIEQRPVMAALTQLSDGGGFIAAYVAYPDGRSVFSDGWEPPADYDPRTRDWYRQAQQANQLIVTAPYLDADSNELVISLSQPLGQSAARGVLASDVSLQAIIETVRRISPTESSFAFLTNQEGQIIAHPDPALTLKTLRDLSPELSNTLLQSAARGSLPEVRVEQRAVLLTSQPIAGTPWVLNIALDKQDALAGVYRMLRWTVALVLIVALAAGGVLWLVTAGGFRRLARVSEAMVDIGQGEGDLTQRMQVEGQDEVARIAEAFNAFVDKIHHLVQEVGHSADSVSAASEELSSITQESARVVSQQSAETDQVATAMNQMTATVQEVAAHAGQAAQQASHADQQTREGHQLLQATLSALQKLDTTLDQSTEAMTALKGGTQDIAGMLDVISAVSEQTNLLALNAAIEAARAGEHGRGFAVVADEVRSLAARTQQSTQDIQQVVDRLFAQTDQVVRVMEASREAAQQTVSRAEEMALRLNQVNQAIEQIAGMNLQIASAAEEQSSVAEEINRNVFNINDLSTQTEDAAANLTQASQELAGQASLLNQQVSQFKV
ncbi:methyl-accepting chemotaxis protein [Marinospirillum sp. MEB164]|uniref:Methyl-accepting chemotaxis protein n=1 Tax=Marinospirillum alkalitolerans TaxID=3123374 RepID=A0ABW8PV66_9GAMM